MCQDGNNAPQSVRYINAQLTSLWQNAEECVHHIGKSIDFKSAEYEKSKYTRALAQYHFFGKKSVKKINSVDDLLFAASFGKPEIQFICNHEAVLHLTVAEGHLNLDFAKASVAGARVAHDKNVPIKGLKVAFRMRFSRSNIRGRDSKIGNGSNHLIQLMILNVDSAKLVMFSASLSHDIKGALAFYMHQYLHFLENAGNHVLFDLPDFDDDKFSPKIDYSIAAKTEDVKELCRDVAVHGVDLAEVNAFLYKQWLRAATLGRPKDTLSICLSEISSAWLLNACIDQRFHVKFAPPTVRALCSHEVILYFKVEDIAFFENDDFDHCHVDMYSNWEIAFIVDVVEEKEEDGCITRIRLDLSTARFSRHLSICEETTDVAIAFFHQIVHFLTRDYLDILVTYHLHYIYYIDVREVPIPTLPVIPAHSDSESESGSEGSWEPVPGAAPKHKRPHGEIVIWKERLEHLHLCGFDQVFAVSEFSINELFLSWWQSASKHEHDHCLSHWSYDMFSASFDAITVRLLSNGHAIVWIKINEGEMAVKTHTSKKNFWTKIGWSKPKTTDTTTVHEFSDLTVAFEVDLKMVEHAHLKVTDSWHTKFAGTHMHLNHHKEITKRIFKHLLLDFHNATYRAELSSTETLCAGEGRHAVERLETVKHYVKHYLCHLAEGGHNIIHSIPLFTGSGESVYGLTSVSYQIVTKTEISVHTCRHSRTVTESPLILILGMCGHRTLPTVHLPWSAGWVIHSKGSRAVGTVCISREVFLEGRLLPMLALVNAKTTVVPDYASVFDGEWQFELTTWAQHRHRRGKLAKWTPVKNGSPHALEYVWEHHDGWNHEHVGTFSEEKNGEYSISCRTKNKLHIPTHYRPNCLEITLSGESSMKLSGKDDYKKWSRQTSASWSASINVHTRPSGLEIEVTGSTKPIFGEVHADGTTSLDIHALHTKYLPGKVDVDEVLSVLKSTLQGTWEYSYPGLKAYAMANPVFTHDGDLIVQLQLPTSTRKTIHVTTTNTTKTGVFGAVSHALFGSHSHSPLLSSRSGVDTPLKTPPGNFAATYFPHTGETKVSGGYDATPQMKITVADGDDLLLDGDGSIPDF